MAWFDAVGCCGYVKLQILGLVVAYINMVVCIIYLVVALTLVVVLTAADIAVQKLNSITAEDIANLVFDMSSSIKDELLAQGGSLVSQYIPPEVEQDLNNVMNGITGGQDISQVVPWRRSGKAAKVELRTLLSGKPLIKKKRTCRSGKECVVASRGSIRDRWELGVVGIKGLVTFKLTFEAVKNLGLIVHHMLLVVKVWSVILSVHLAFIVVLVIGLNQERRKLVVIYCIFGAMLWCLLVLMFFSHATICSKFPNIYFLHICLYLYTLVVMLAYICEYNANYVEPIEARGA